MIIKFEPHGFVVFLTLVMGMIFAVSNSRSDWGFWKIALTVIFVLPTLYYGFIIGRVVEVVLGSIIGWAYGRGGISLPYFRLNPFGGIGDWLRNRKYDREQRREEERNKRRQSKSEKKPNSSYEDEINKHKEQARSFRKSNDSNKEKSKFSDEDDSTYNYKQGKSKSNEGDQTEQELSIDEITELLTKY